MVIKPLSKIKSKHDKLIIKKYKKNHKIIFVIHIHDKKNSHKIKLTFIAMINLVMIYAKKDQTFKTQTH